MTGFCGQYVIQFVTESYIFTDEAWFHLSGNNSVQNSRYWTSVDLGLTSEVPLHEQIFGVWCHYYFMNIGPIFF